MFRQLLNLPVFNKFTASRKPLLEEALNSVQVVCDKPLTIYLLETPKAAFCKLIRQGIRENTAIYEGKTLLWEKCKANRQFAGWNLGLRREYRSPTGEGRNSTRKKQGTHQWLTSMA
jgi:hypothetical protein